MGSEGAETEGLEPAEVGADAIPDGWEPAVADSGGFGRLDPAEEDVVGPGPACVALVDALPIVDPHGIETGTPITLV